MVTTDDETPSRPGGVARRRCVSVPSARTAAAAEAEAHLERREMRTGQQPGRVRAHPALPYPRIPPRARRPHRRHRAGARAARGLRQAVVARQAPGHRHAALHRHEHPRAHPEGQGARGLRLRCALLLGLRDRRDLARAGARRRGGAHVHPCRSPWRHRAPPRHCRHRLSPDDRDYPAAAAPTSSPATTWATSRRSSPPRRCSSATCLPWP